MLRIKLPAGKVCLPASLQKLMLQHLLAGNATHSVAGGEK